MESLTCLLMEACGVVVCRATKDQKKQVVGGGRRMVIGKSTFRLHYNGPVSSVKGRNTP